MESKKKNIAIIISSVLLFCVGVIFIIAQFMAHKDFTSKYDENQQKISKLSEASEQETINESESLQEVENTEEMTTETVESAMEKLYSAKEKGNEVAYYQNRYQNLDVVDHEAAFLENASIIEGYLAEEAKSGRGTWYYGYMKHEWTFNTTYYFEEESVPVLWTCRDENGNLLAYTFGEYDAVNQVFFNIDSCMTSVGARYMSAG